MLPCLLWALQLIGERQGRVYGMGSSMQKGEENMPLGRRATRAAELNSRAPCQDEGGAERERKYVPKSSGRSKLSSRDSKERPRESQRNGRLYVPHRN